MWRTTTCPLPFFVVLRISIHVPRVEDDAENFHERVPVVLFQSTSPVWRTTRRLFHRSVCTIYFNPRPPCGGRPAIQYQATERFQFQSTSPVWRTTQLNDKTRLAESFQSTSPVWRTTCVVFVFPSPLLISIHVPRVEDDPALLRQYALIRSEFQSTSPVWRTTPRSVSEKQKSNTISIHVPRVEDDLHTTQFSASVTPFQSTSPVWRTTSYGWYERIVSLFQSTSPVWRTTSMQPRIKTV